jgi:hypothetical protein
MLPKLKVCVANATFNVCLNSFSKIAGEEEEKYWENVYRIVAAKKQMKHEKWAERKREKRRARNAAARMLQEEFGAAEHESNFDSLLDQRQGGDEQDQVGKIIIDPNLRTKRKKKRDRNTSSRYANLDTFNFQYCS